MERSVYDLTLDMQQNHAFREITVKKGDTHRRLRFRLLSGGSTYPVSNDCYGVFTAQKPDGTVLYNRCSREGDRFTYDLTPQTSAAPGVLSCELRLYGPADALLTTAAFALRVEDTVYTEGEEAVTSTGEATALTQLITQAREGICEMEKVLQNEVNHAVIDDAKVGKDAWSGKNIADKLCPAFGESGAAVRCEPVEGYPLEVISNINPKESGDPWGEIKLYHSGKNLFGYDTFGAIKSLNNDVALTEIENGVRATATRRAAGVICTIGRWLPISPLDGKKIIISFTMTRSATTLVPTLCVGYCNETINTRKIVAQKAATGDITKVSFAFEVNSASTEAAGCTHIGLWFYVNINTSPTKIGDYTDFTDFQIEIGDTATAFEPYKGTTVYTVDFSNYGLLSEGSYNWTTGVLTDEAGNLYQHNPETNTFKMIDEESTAVVRGIHAFPGVNTLISDCGDTTAKGKADPVSVIEKLTNAIIALGGNV